MRPTPERRLEDRVRYLCARLVPSSDGDCKQLLMELQAAINEHDGLASHRLPRRRWFFQATLPAVRPRPRCRAYRTSGRELVPEWEISLSKVSGLDLCNSSAGWSNASGYTQLGFRSRQDVAALPNVRVIPEGGAFPGPDPS